MPKLTRDELVAYWSGVQDESGLAVDWAEAHQRCWRCAYRSTLEFCHIIPHARGGPYEASNLVLLCGRCHREAPNHTDPRYMWIWLRANCVPLYDTYWTTRGMAEFENMFGRPAMLWAASREDADELSRKFGQLYRKGLEQAIVHFGEGRLNPSTIACVMARAESDLAQRLGVPLS